MGVLYDDIILLVFSKLPLKTLCKFQCVSRRWQELISTKYYLALQREESKRNPKVLLLHDDGVSLSSMTLEELDHHDHDGETTLLLNQFTPLLERTYVTILPCKGEIVCLASESKFYLCKPSTREFICLPEPSPFTFGDPDSAFGYILSADEYKLVHLYTDQIGIRCEIFTISNGEEVGNRSWRIIEDKCPYPVQGDGIMVNNSFYWVTFDEDDSVPRLILSFDLETETFGTMAGPPILDPNDSMKQVELKGFLCVVDNFFEQSTIVIWMLKDGGNNNQEVWVKEYSIYVPGFGHHYLSDDITAVYDRDEEIMLYDRKNSIYYYNTESGKVRRVANGITSRMELGFYIDGFFSLGK